MPLRDMDRQQMWLLPPTLDELVPLDHPAGFVAEFVDALDRDAWAELGVEIAGDPLGAPAYHPRALVSVWLYGFMTGVRSCRKLEAACRDQIPYLWLTGWQHPDHDTLWRFYQRRRQGMRVLFKCTVRTAVVSPATSDGEVAGMLVTAADVCAQPDDHAQLIPMLEQAEGMTGVRVPLTLANGGCHSGKNLKSCAANGRRVLMPDSKKKLPGGRYHKDRFIYDEASDSYTCPQSQRLRFQRYMMANTARVRLCRTSRGVCQNCPAFGECTIDHIHGRGLGIGPDDDILRQHRALMATNEAKLASRRRGQLIEPVFGILKEQMRMRRFALRGLLNVVAKWTLAATAFNLRTLWRIWRARPPLCASFRESTATVF